MNKKKISKKRAFSLNDLQPIKLHDESIFEKSTAQKSFKNKAEVAKILFECLEDNDTESFIEILDAYLDVNRTQIAEKTNLTRNTITQAFSKKGNPTLRTLAKIISEATTFRK
jgi:DNA-binding phage protein